ALSSLVLRAPSKPRRQWPWTRWGARLTELYARVLGVALARPRAVLALALALLLGAGAVASQLGAELVPRLREGTIVINTVRLAGVSIDESVRYGTRIERLLLERFPDEIERIWTRTGTGEVATDPMGVEVSDVFVTLTPEERWRRGESQDELVTAMAAELESLPGMRSIFTQPIELRVNEMAAGVRADVGVLIYGDDFEVLREKAREIEALLSGIEGAADVVTEPITGQPVLRIEVDRQAIARHGI